MIPVTVRNSPEPSRQPSTASDIRVAPAKAFILTMAAVAVLMVGAAWVWAAKGRMWFLDPEYPMWLANMQMLDACDVGETAILGDSRAKAAIVPALIGDTVVNLAVGGASPVETNRAVEDIVRCPVLPKRVIFSFSPAYLLDAQVYWERTAQFNYLSFDQMENVRRASLQLNDPMLYSTSPIHTVFDSISNYGYKVNFPSHYFPAMVNAGFVSRKARNDFELDKTLLDRGHHYFGMDSESNWYSEEGILSDFRPPALLSFYFEKTIAMLEQKGIKMYFVASPMNETTHKRVNPDFAREFLGYIKGIGERHPGFDILGNPVQYLPDNNFGDCEHLNSRGATVFSQSLAKLLAVAVSQERDASRPQ